MEILMAVMLWPMIVFLVGSVFVFGESLEVLLVYPMVLFFLAVIFVDNDQFGARIYDDKMGGLDRIRRATVAFSIAMLFPIFMKYLLDSFGASLTSMVFGLVLSFAIITWGIFAKKNKVLMYSNIVGGLIAIIYLYFKIWNLGQLAQVIATASGLLMAVVISVIKFKDKLI